MYETDQVFPVITAVEELTGRRYQDNPEDDVHMRVVADHIRSSMMLIWDGVRPGNDGRGYVLRRLLRRSIRSMRLLGMDAAALPTLFPVSRDAMAPAYPELLTSWDTIADVAYGEEDAFRRTLSAGTTIFESAVKAAKTVEGPAVLSGAEAFTLHDTYGFPIDLTLEMAAEKGVEVDEAGFRALMTEQKERARADARSKKTGHTDVRIFHDIEKEMGGGSTFVGYTDDSTEAVVHAILVDGQPAPAATAPAEVEIILDRTPFYAEMGGQLADHGTIRMADGAVVEIHDVQAPIKGLAVHRGTLTEGTMTVGEKAWAEIDTTRRLAIARAHTATHMVHKALHEIVSEQATQAGSENSPSRMRFDFRHGQALSSDQMGDIEYRVNERLADNLSVTEETMSLDEARNLGAMALFGEKYGNEVRVVSIGDDWSRELCAGTHVDATGQIGRLTLLGEGSIGSGVRRIDALVGDGAYSFQAKEHALVSQITSMVGGRPEELATRIETMMTKLKDAERELEQVRMAAALARGEQIANNAVRRGKVLLAAQLLGEMPSADAIRNLALDVRDRLGEAEPVVVALIGIVNDKPSVTVVTNDAARQHTFKAGALVRLASKILGGGGGGRDDIAQGGGQDASAADQAVSSLIEEIGRQ